MISLSGEKEERGIGGGEKGDCEGVIKGNLFNQFKAGRLRSFKAVL